MKETIHLLWMTLVIILILIVVILYMNLRIVRVELVKLTEKLKFISENDTNMQLYTDAKVKELDMFVQQINKLISDHQRKSIVNKQTEQEFKQAITNLSHDLRTPLTSASGYIQMLKSDKTQQSKKAEYIDIVERRIESLRKMLDTLFEFSRLQSDEYDIEMSKVDVCSVLCDTISLYYDDFNEKGITPEINIGQERCFIYADKTALSRIFGNLLSNTLKHGGGDFRVSVSCYEEVVEVKFINRTDKLTEVDARQLLDRFYIADKSRSSQNTGLGLAIVKELVHKTEGEVSVNYLDGFLTISIKYKLM